MSELRGAGLRKGVALLCCLGAGITAQGVRAGLIEAVNHTHWAINRFSVDGEPGLDIIGPYQGGGGGCCYVAPAQWRPDLTVRVTWQAGIAFADDSPGFANWPKYLEWERKVDAQTRHLTRVVSVPNYDGEKRCGITVHFLPCDELQVTTSCYAYGSPHYPIKTPLRLPEPLSCQK
ncbi:DUF3304 domain-containing protein [Pseudomonas sp. TE3610]